MNQQPNHDHHGHHPSDGHDHGWPDTPIEHATHGDRGVQHSNGHANLGMHAEPAVGAAGIPTEVTMLTPAMETVQRDMMPMLTMIRVHMPGTAWRCSVTGSG